MRRGVLGPSAFLPRAGHGGGHLSHLPRECDGIGGLESVDVSEESWCCCFFLNVVVVVVVVFFFFFAFATICGGLAYLNVVRLITHRDFLK